MHIHMHMHMHIHICTSVYTQDMYTHAHTQNHECARPCIHITLLNITYSCTLYTQSCTTYTHALNIHVCMHMYRMYTHEYTCTYTCARPCVHIILHTHARVYTIMHYIHMGCMWIYIVYTTMHSTAFTHVIHMHYTLDSRVYAHVPYVYTCIHMHNHIHMHVRVYTFIQSLHTHASVFAHAHR